MQVPTLKQKLTVSRALATTLKNRIFMRTLYELLDVHRFLDFHFLTIHPHH